MISNIYWLAGLSLFILSGVRNARGLTLELDTLSAYISSYPCMCHILIGICPLSSHLEFALALCRASARFPGFAYELNAVAGQILLCAAAS